VDQPDMVIVVIEGQVGCISNANDVDYLILNFDRLSENVTTEEVDRIHQMVKVGQYNEASEALADLEAKYY
jgi:hypothetical protein